MPPAIPQTPPQPTDLLMYVTVMVIFMLMIAVALVGFLIWDKFIEPRRQARKRREHIRHLELDRLIDAAERQAWINVFLAEQREHDDTIILPYVSKEYYDAI